jgi:hypothetical protein
MTDLKSRMPKTNTISKATKITDKIDKNVQNSKKASGKVIKGRSRKIVQKKDDLKKLSVKEGHYE